MWKTIVQLCVISSFIWFSTTESDIGQLPFCSENSVPGLVLVSTIDGKFSAINTEGLLKWQIDTDPGPLLTSNIHNLELTNSGKWIRIIPSLKGTLYRFDGRSIDPILISAESLLKSSFKYSDELVIAGGFEVRTYGIGFKSGKVIYVCSPQSCVNNTNSESEVEDVLLLERNTQTVRAIDTQSGHERWNFSVGHHNIKLPQITCVDQTSNLFNWNISAIIPDGLLIASNSEENVKTSWQYHFNSPIVRIWKWDGKKISEIDLFAIKTDKSSVGTQISPSIYLGMHKKQLYIHESLELQQKSGGGVEVAEAASLIKIPWKPISATGLLTEDDSTALSVLYSSEYVNGHGYYLYSESDIKQKNSGFCGNNFTSRFPALKYNSEKVTNILSLWWKEIIVVALTTTVVFHLMFQTYTRHLQAQKYIILESKPESTISRDSSQRNISESSDNSPFSSRFMNDFDTLRCLGTGGFGVVFEVKQKIDECHYAIKRTILPNEKDKRDTVMREVKALAKLEHGNIVRYFNSWVEKPPLGWKEQHDIEWFNETEDYRSENIASPSVSSNLPSYKTDKSSGHFGFNPGSFNERLDVTTNDSFIVFNEDSQGVKDNIEDTLDTNSNNTEIINFDDSVKSGIDWRRPSRRYHSVTEKCPPTFLYIQMQLCQRQSLKEWLSDNKDRHFDNIIDIFKQIVSAVEYVHLQGLIHRDLKPSNIFFSLEGQIKVGDFGLVKDVDEAYDVATSWSLSRGHTKEVGTRLYMSPEQVSGKKYNYKVDIYSLGLIFFELLVYFNTDMERIKTLTMLRDYNFPKDFVDKYADEHKLLSMMLCQSPEKRLTTFGIKARPPLNCCDPNYNSVYDFELPKPVKSKA